MTPKKQIVIDTINRFPSWPNNTIAKYILECNGALFNNSLDAIRGTVRYYRGAIGDNSRERASLIIERTEPVKMPATWARERLPYHLPQGKWLAIGDLHIPFHSPLAIESAVKYGKKQGITGVLMVGDIQDYQGISYWPLSQRENFNGEIEATIDFLDYLNQQFPKAVKVFKPGNHEYRLPRLYYAKIPQLATMGTLAMETVLNFEGRGIKFLDYLDIVMAGKLPILHGHEIRQVSAVVNPARGLFLKTKTWAMCFHYHNTSEHSDKDLYGTYLTTWSVGCLCDLMPDYNPFGNRWNWGFAIVETDKAGNFTVENKRILPNGEVV
jgi:hypothetical protein